MTQQPEPGKRNPPDEENPVEAIIQPQIEEETLPPVIQQAGQQQIRPQQPQNDLIQSSSEDINPEPIETNTGALEAREEPLSVNVTPNIRIEGNAVDFVYESNENGISIFINVNGSANPEPENTPVLLNDSTPGIPLPENQPEVKNDFPRYQITVVIALFGILVCAFVKVNPFKRENQAP